MNAITFDQAVSTLTNEGHKEDDVLAAIDSLIIAGLDVEDAISETDLDVLRDQLSA